MLSLNYWTSQRLNCWVLSLLFRLHWIFWSCCLSWTNKPQRCQGQEMDQCLCEWFPPTSLALMQINPMRVFRQITWGVLFARKVEMPRAVCPPAGPEGGLDDQACHFYVSKAKHWAGASGWSVGAVVWPQPSVTAPGPSSSGFPQLSCPFPFLCKECDTAVGSGFQLLLSLSQSCVSQVKGYAGVKAHFQQKRGEVQIIPLAGFGRRESSASHWDNKLLN